MINSKELSNTELSNTELINGILSHHKARRVYLSDVRCNIIMKNQYQAEAVRFLHDTKTTISIRLVGKEVPSWGKGTQVSVNKYWVTLKNEKHEYSFAWYDSIANTEAGKLSQRDFYSVLACLDSYVPESFDEFCGDYGYTSENESDYIHVKSIHLACIDQTKNLKKLWTSEELERLSEIN